MNMSEMADDGTIKQVTYHLFGVIVHRGSASSGHYWTYRRAGDPTTTNEWYKFDCKFFLLLASLNPSLNITCNSQGVFIDCNRRNG
jgi:ubiquitin C-terminal hydrolase